MKKIHTALMILLSVVLFSNFQCEHEEKEETGRVEYLAYGTSFGECVGYCVREIIVSGGITFTKSGWLNGEALEDSSCNYVFITDPLPAYLEDLDQEAFLAMDDTLGCPDCADGGAEWMEIGFENTVKRVTFEYMNEPNELTGIISELRETMESFNDCRASE